MTLGAKNSIAHLRCPAVVDSRSAFSSFVPNDEVPAETIEWLTANLPEGTGVAGDPPARAGGAGRGGLKGPLLSRAPRFLARAIRAPRFS